MGISSTKRGIRTHAANQEYRDNWDRLFGEKPVDLSTYNFCASPEAVDEVLNAEVNPVIHVDKYDTLETWCGLEDVGDKPVYGSEWRDEPWAIIRATCTACLCAIWEFGDWAERKLNQMEMDKEKAPTPVKESRPSPEFGCSGCDDCGA